MVLSEQLSSPVGGACVFVLSGSVHGAGAGGGVGGRGGGLEAQLVPASGTVGRMRGRRAIE